MKFKSYFSGRFILSKNALLSLVLSDRSDGKTFDCKARILEHYEKNGDIGVYIRRWKTEIDQNVYNKFFNETWENNENYIRFSNWEFKGSKSKIEVRKNKNDRWDTICYLIPLSVASRWKSKIQEINRIKVLNYDEYVPMDNRYLPKETTLLMDLWKTLDRDRDILQIIVLGNRIVPFCPILDYYNIDLKIGNKDMVRLYKEDTLAVQIYSNKEHREKTKALLKDDKTDILKKLGKYLIESTDPDVKVLLKTTLECITIDHDDVTIEYMVD